MCVIHRKRMCRKRRNVLRIKNNARRRVVRFEGRFLLMRGMGRWGW